MPHQTRSGRFFKPAFYCGGVQQTSPWGQTTDILTNVLPGYLVLPDILNSRAVCRAWKEAFGGHINSLHMVQPLSQSTARARGRKAAAAFPSTTTLHLELYRADLISVGYVDLTGNEAVFTPTEDGLMRPLAAAALLRPFRTSSTLTTLRLSNKGEYTGLTKVLPVLPKLQCLDLSGCRHLSSDLGVIASHLQHLQELVLCRNAILRVFYDPHDIEALGRLPRLQRLQIVPISMSAAVKKCWAALGTLTGLTSLHALTPGSHHCYGEPTPSDATRPLSALTRLRELKCRAGWFDWKEDRDVLAQHWTAPVAGLTALTELELSNIALRDTLLQGLSNLQQLHKLVLDVHYEGVKCTVTAAGARAVAHVQHIEVSYFKGLSCKRVKPLLQLPGLRRFGSTSTYARGQGPHEIGHWSDEDCICGTCFWKRRARLRDLSPG